MADMKKDISTPAHIIISGKTSSTLQSLKSALNSDIINVPLETPPRTSTESESKYIDQVRSNVKSDLKEITDDKLENILLKYLSLLTIRTAWITPFSIFLATLITKLTAKFNDTFGIKAPVWEAVFILAIIAAFIWFIVDIVLLIKGWKDSSMEKLLTKIKNA